jgi:hypothetical protein
MEHVLGHNKNKIWRRAMKVGALILGIIGGLLTLLYGLLGYGLGSMAGAVGLKIVSIGLPILGLVGAGMVMAKPIIGAVLMGIATVGLMLILGFNFFSLIPIVLLGLGTLLGFLGSQETSGKNERAGNEYDPRRSDLQRKSDQQDEDLVEINDYEVLQIAYDYQYNHRDFEKARYYLEIIRKNFPESEYLTYVEQRLREMRS